MARRADIVEAEAIDEYLLCADRQVDDRVLILNHSCRNRSNDVPPRHGTRYRA
jgi:hypothetical protein